MPTSVTNIEGCFIVDCSYATITINYAGTSSQWNSIIKEENWNYVENGLNTTLKVICSDKTLTIALID